MALMTVGLIGCGRISDIYIQNLQRFDEIDLVACASLDLAESQAKAAQWGIPKACAPDDIYTGTNIDCVLNLTIPAAHASVSRRALKSGKHVYSEKPFVTNLTDGQELLELAKQGHLLIGNAPDTFLGGRMQTARRVIDEGLIGEPTGCMAFVGTHGVERHNPNPDFYYQTGGGPLLDLGPYYLTALVFLLGPIASVAGMSRRTFDQRMIENGPRYGEVMPVEVDTHELSMFKFQSGVIGSMTMSFDVWDSESPRLEIYGTEGTLCIPDPDPVHGTNQFGGQVWYRTKAVSRWAFQPRPEGREGWLVAENRHGFNDNSRGLGLLDLAYAVRDNRDPRASGTLAQHVFDVMDSMQQAARERRYVDVASRCTRPDPFPENFPQSEQL